MHCVFGCQACQERTEKAITNSSPARFTLYALSVMMSSLGIGPRYAEQDMPVKKRLNASGTRESELVLIGT